MMPITMIREFFITLGANVSTLDWDKLKQRSPDLLCDYFYRLPQDLRQQADAILRNVFKLACSEGMTAINDSVELLHHEPITLGAVPNANCYARALMTWKTDKDVFQQSLVLLQLRQLSWWRKRRNVPRKMPIFSETVKQNFERRIETLFINKQSRGYVCTIEMFEIENGMFYFFAYPDDYPKPVLQHNEFRALISHTLLHTFEIIFAYDSRHGTLEICGRVSDSMKTELEEIFITTVLDAENVEPSKCFYNLSVLKNIHNELRTEITDYVHVAVQAILFEEGGLRYSINAGSCGDLYEEIQNRNELKKLLANAVQIEEAKFRFTFFQKANRPCINVTFEIGVPHKNTIRQLPDEFVKIINKYLERWGIEQHARVA
jgi:hypothetical protein